MDRRLVGGKSLASQFFCCPSTPQTVTDQADGTGGEQGNCAKVRA